MTYPQTLDYLYTQLPMFTRVGASAFKATLDNTIALCNRLDNPQHRFKSVHVGGTNGKGSTSHMLAAILQVAGYKTGLYTSPHLRDFRERIRINGQMISEQEVVAFVAKHQSDFEEIQPSFFEMTVAMAFDIFARERVDIAVIEVGLGGRLDSTNVISPLLSVITNIGWDHMNILGDTLPLIAGEKAGIIKPKTPVIIGEYQPEVASVFIEKAQAGEAALLFASEQWEIKHELNPEQRSEFLEFDIKRTPKTSPENPVSNRTSPISHLKEPVSNLTSPISHLEEPVSNLTSPISHLSLDLPGTYQLKNIKTVLCAIDELRAQGFNISDEHIETALKQVRKLTGLDGRWQVLNRQPLTICDTGHNPEGIKEVLENIAATPYEHLHFVIGMVNDKDSAKVLSMLPATATYYFCKPDIPRGLEAKSLQEKAESFKLKGNVYPDVKSALEDAQQNAGDNDLVFVGGSTFVVAEVV